MTNENVLRACLITREGSESVNVVDGLLAIAGAIEGLSRALDRLGTNGASTPMGAIELLSLQIKEAGASVARGLCEIAANLVDGGQRS
jgi:hypothetical protein